MLLLFIYALLQAKPYVPDWFIKSFNAQHLASRYRLVTSLTPAALQADFNGDGLNDVAMFVEDKTTKERGVIILNQGKAGYFLVGAGKTIPNEDFKNTNWADSWRIDSNNQVYETVFDKEGDIKGARKVSKKFPGISVYATQDGTMLAGILIYWDGTRYRSIHQGE